MQTDSTTTNPHVTFVGQHSRCGCNICGDGQGASMPVCRYWDADDGWTFGVLCQSCYRHCRKPRADDYASPDGSCEQPLDDIC